MMYERQIKRFLIGSILALTLAGQASAQSPETRPDACERATLITEAGRMTDLETLTRAEQRAEALRAKLFDLQMQEIDLQNALYDLDLRLKPDNIQRALMFVSSPRPMDEFREGLRARLEYEKAGLTKKLELLISSRERLEAEIGRADAEVERLRQRMSNDR